MVLFMANKYRTKLPIAGDALAMAKTSQTAALYANKPAPKVERPARGSSFEAWLAYYETVAPGGEFNHAFAKDEVEGE